MSGLRACNHCSYLEVVRSQTDRSLTYNCNNTACFRLGKFDPLTGLHEKHRERDFDSMDMNAIGKCPHFVMKMIL